MQGDYCVVVKKLQPRLWKNERKPTKINGRAAGAHIASGWRRNAAEMTLWVKRKKYLKNNWLVRVELKPSGTIDVPSYAALFPEGLERIVAEETERSLLVTVGVTVTDDSRL